jgi:xylan 1,4-beta-xylosidase
VWACRNEQGAVQVLLWDYTHPKQDTPNAEFFARDWPSKPTAPVRLNVANLQLGSHTVNITRVGYGHNDVYTAYLELGSPTGLPDKPCHLPDDVLTDLRASCTGEPEKRVVSVDQNGTLTLDLPLNENDVYLITVEP